MKLIYPDENKSKKEAQEILEYALTGRRRAKKLLIPMASASKISIVPPDLFSKFRISFYKDPVDAVYKSLGLS